MTAREQVVRTQRFLQAAAITTSLLWGIAAALLVLSIAALLQRIGAAERLQPDGWVAIVLGVITWLVLLRRARFTRYPRRVALWIEERIPELQYALVTASDPSVALGTVPLETAVQQFRVDSLVTPAILAPVGRAAVAATAAVIALVLTSTLAGARLQLAGHSALSRIGINTPLPNRLTALSVRILPPSYAGASARVVNDPSGITALVGSTIAVSGSGGRVGIGAALQDRQLHARGASDAWELSFAMPLHATTLALTDRGFHRVIAIIPVVDQPPTVSMIAPTRDTVWRKAPTTAMNFDARATDDIGLDRGYFEYTITTGAGEIFKARSANFGASVFGGSTRGAMRAALALPPLKLVAGDVLSVRAVVIDGNTVTGPGITTSDTRTFRVARADEYDSLAVEGAPPPPVERSMLTERMLMISAESLLKQRAPLGRKAFVESSGRIGIDQASLRKRVYDIVYGHEEAGGTTGVEGDDQELDPQLVINRDLKEAYDAMWDAERALMVGDVTPALPSMQKALRALDRARLANRLYLRGRTPRVIVNIEKVRLVGKDKGASNTAAPRSRADTVAELQRRSFDHALDLAHGDPAAFSDELIRLRAEAASTNVALSAALRDAADAIRAGHDATPALVRARRTLSGAVRVGNAATPWVGAWSSNTSSSR
ncbi:MAG: hypothetical protein ACR2MQ_10025 [Gemmatimonadaceae bacterium]